jgi:hypothetical protein
VFHRPTTKALTVIELVIKQYIKSAEFIKLSDDKTSIADAVLEKILMVRSWAF